MEHPLRSRPLRDVCESLKKLVKQGLVKCTILGNEMVAYKYTEGRVVDFTGLEVVKPSCGTMP